MPLSPGRASATQFLIIMNNYLLPFYYSCLFPHFAHRIFCIAQGVLLLTLQKLKTETILIIIATLD